MSKKEMKTAKKISPKSAKEKKGGVHRVSNSEGVFLVADDGTRTKIWDRATRQSV